MANLIQYEYQDNLISFEIDEEIMVNATQMAKPFGKLIGHFLENKEAKEFIKSLKNRQSVRYRNSDNGQIVIVIQGGSPEKQGTWMHRQLAIRFAMWLNADFAVWVTDKIDTLMQTGSVSIASNATTKDDLLALKTSITEDLKGYIDDKFERLGVGLEKNLQNLGDYLMGGNDLQSHLERIMVLLQERALDTALLRDTLRMLLVPIKRRYISVRRHVIYLLKQEGKMRYKIGYSADVLTREDALDIWGDAFLVHQIMVGAKQEALLIERLLHRIFEDKYIEREIYALDKEDEKFFRSL